MEWQRLVTSIFVRASSLLLRLCLHPTTTTPGQATMTMARGAALAAIPATLPKVCAGKGDKYACAR
jgi:hypothetical protein